MKLKQHLLATALCVLPIAASAAPRAAQMPFTWTGFYVGATVGGVSNSAKAGYDDTLSGSYYGNTDATGAGITGGLTVGYNYQMNTMVLGIEADFNFASISKDSHSFSTFGYDLWGTSKLGNFGTVRGRVGYAFDRSMVYATAGVAFADVKGSQTFYETIPACTAGFSKTKAGLTAGVGVEHFVTNNVTVKAEVLFTDLGTTTALSPLGCTSRFKNTFTVGRLGMNYRF
jgi:outer membrane immunogenic protein